MIQTQADRHNRHAGKVSFTLLARKPDNRRRDLDNLCKASQDLLVRHGILIDDSHIVRTSSEWTTELPSGAMLVIEDL
jgi:Holliday junction resolvase RusA-like endonuclease